MKFNALVRVSTAALLAASCLSLSGSAGGVRNASAVTSCSVHPDDITLQARLTEYKYREYFSGGGVTFSPKKTILSSVPAGRITATFCVGKSGTAWTVQTYRQLIEYAYYSMDSSLHLLNGGPGYTIKLARPNPTSLTVEPVRCLGSGGALELAKFVTGLPLPGVSYPLSVLQWVVGNAIPAGSTSCQAFADETVPFSFNSAGYSTASTISRTYYIKDRYTLNECASITGTTTCYDVDQLTWQVTDVSAGGS